jgi:hypothetical protein
MTTRTCHCGRTFAPRTRFHTTCADCHRRAEDERDRFARELAAAAVSGIGPCAVCGTQYCADARALGNPLLCD